MTTHAPQIAQAPRPPAVRRLVKHAYYEARRAHHAIADIWPGVIRPHPRQITIAITADCNLRCQGCRYGRDFMAGERLSLSTVRDVIDDAAAGGVGKVRFYGGEPLLHPDLPAMVAHATRRELGTYITTNGTHLGPKIRPLYEAGLRLATIGFYGIDDAYEAHTQRRGHFQRLERSLQTVRETYGRDFALQLNFVVMRASCSAEALDAAWAFAQRFDMYFHLDLAGPNIPFFDAGPQAGVSLREEDRQAAEALACRMLQLKHSDPGRFLHSEQFIRSVPDWVIEGTSMRVPCDAYELLWIGADGSLQLCDTALPLGNVRTQRLRDILFSEAHAQAARDAFRLNCPNCTCCAETRIAKHGASYRRYSHRLAGESGGHV